MTTSTSSSLRRHILDRARALGFDDCAIVSPGALDGAAPSLDRAAKGLRDFLARGYHGDMAWMADTAARRAHPRALWPEVRSIIVLATNYGPARRSSALEHRPERGAISVYAQGRDYHDVIKKRLKHLARDLVARSGAEVKVFVDTAPVMEKPLAQAAGLGWQGKHTNLVSRRFGSWLFLGSIFTTLELAPDPPGKNHCGACRACLDCCPTDAFPAPFRLDARRCISYLTIEHKGHIPRGLRPGIGNRIYGCDICLAVCPWNKFAVQASEPAFAPRIELTAPRLADLARLDDAGFRRVFAGSPLKRVGRDRFVRNVLIALGNSADPGAIPVAERLLDDGSALVRAMAVWALSRLLPAADFAALRARRRDSESDAAVRAEWDGAEWDEPAPPD
jgi:epoxyqueuosine reductase